MDDENDERIFGKSQVEQLRWFEERYEVLAHKNLAPDSGRIYLGDRAARGCRYCGASRPETTFKKVAHAFPEQIGNKSLVDNLECDRCNEHFASRVEDDFSKWTMPLRTIGRTKGKRGVPTFKTSDGNVRIEAPNAQEIHIAALKDDPRYKIDDVNRTLSFSMERQPYIPMGAFKCLVKMALAVMPDVAATRCEHLKRWILEPTHTFESYPFQPLNVIFQSIPGPLPPNRITYFLLRRKSTCSDSPYMVFVLQFSNAVFQTMLPMHVEDRVLIEAGNFETRLYPHIWGSADYVATYGGSGFKVEDLSSCNVVQGEVVEMRLSYEKATGVALK